MIKDRILHCNILHRHRRWFLQGSTTASKSTTIITKEETTSSMLSVFRPLHLDIQRFYESLGMKVEHNILLLLVEKQELNEAQDGEQNIRK